MNSLLRVPSRNLISFFLRSFFLCNLCIICMSLATALVRHNSSVVVQLLMFLFSAFEFGGAEITTWGDEDWRKDWVWEVGLVGGNLFFTFVSLLVKFTPRKS